ncbi:MAG: hypothetical protein F2667_05590 [Actinobacteria bacterium]|uniref:Unannotated protein n=1 Tax=freshwater metagenome TaxID=449393 RepID=A0A6J6Q655_9ZZZZ|nr:hypothetical protein [Actinomycetota bacterium]
MARDLPSGRVTFAFTDVVGSTRAFAEHGEVYAAALGPLQETIARHTAAHGGAVVKTEGDGAFLAFPTAGAAVEALVAAQGEIEIAPPEGLHLRIRAGAHTGEAEPIDDDYLAFAVHVAARVSSTAGAGQLVVSQAVIDDLPAPVGTRVGEFVLKDIDGVTALWQVVGDDSPLRAQTARRTNVSATRTSFVGRDHDLRNLAKLTREPGLVTVLGPGGLGKTRLVTELALAEAPQRPGGAWLVELASVSEPTEVLPAVASVLGLSGTPSIDAVAAELRSRGEAILVVDNCEHVIESAADLAVELLERCPAVRLVCTSREPLMVSGEQVLRLTRLTGAPSAHELEDGEPVTGSTSPAQRLFIDRAQSGGAVIDRADTAAITHLCELLDGLPLALELAAAQAAHLPLAELVSGIESGELELRRRGGAARQRSLDDLVRWSLDLVPPEDRIAAQALSLLPGRFSAAMAEEILQAVPGARRLAAPRLVRQSLLDLDGDEFRMLVTVRQVARAELAAQPQLEESAHQAVFDWAVAHAPVRVAASNVSLDELRTSESAFAWGRQQSRPGIGRILLHLSYALLSRGTGGHTRDLAEGILDDPTPETLDEVRLYVAALKLVIGLGTGRDSEVDRLLGLLRITEAGDDEALHLLAASLTGSLLDRAGRYAEARAVRGVVIDAARGPEHSSLLAGELTNVGVAHHLAGEFAAAEAAYREGWAVAAPDDVNSVICRANLGELMVDTGRFEEAAEHLRAALPDARRFPVMAGAMIAELVGAEVGRGAVEQARTLARQAERELAYVVAADPSLQYVADRMREALASIDD